MSGKFQPIGDLFNQAVADVRSAKGLPVEKPWAQKTEDEKMSDLLTYCLRSSVFSRSRPEFDQAWFEMVHRTTAATMDDLKAVLEDNEGYMQELIERGAFKYKDVRRHVLYRLKKYLANKAHLMKKKQSYPASPVQRIQAKIELPKEQLCHRCMKYLPRDLFTLDGVCADCAESECAVCHGMFKTKLMKRRVIRFYCETCFKKL